MNQRPPRSGPWAFLGQSILFGLALAFVITLLAPGLAERLRNGGEPPGGSGAHPQQPVDSYRPAVERAGPAVVSIYADKIVTERSLRLVPDPIQQRYSAVGLGPPRQRLERSLGSGVIVSDDGFVLTNHHVIAGAEDIQVVLQDGRVTQAEIVGSDRDTDLAVLRIDGQNLPALRLEADTDIHVGDVVLAIGNPFGLGQTVTQGIISALGRSQLQLATYEDFIQTDAAINRGNSGGALVNARGELVGINTAAFTQRVPDASGIGFAIPTSTARLVLDQLVNEGRVIRGWLGAEFLDAPRASQGSARGATIAMIHPGSPAELAGLRPGDLLVGLDGEPVRDAPDLRRREAELAPGRQAQLSVLRAGVPFTLDIEVASRPVPGAP